MQKFDRAALGVQLVPSGLAVKHRQARNGFNTLEETIHFPHIFPSLFCHLEPKFGETLAVQAGDNRRIADEKGPSILEEQRVNLNSRYLAGVGIKIALP